MKVWFLPPLFLIGLLSAIALFLLGSRKQAAYRNWTTWLALLGSWACISFGLGFFYTHGRSALYWFVPWLLTRGEMNQVVLGMVWAPLGAVFTVSAYMVLTLLLLIGERTRDSGKETMILTPSLLLSTVGLAMAWCSSTPWLILAGLAVVTLAASVFWMPNQLSAGLVALVLCFSGVLLLYGVSVHLSGDSAVLLPGARGLLATGLITAGVLTYMCAFPRLLRPREEGSERPVEVFVLSLLFPGITALALPLRLYGELRDVGGLEFLGWAATASAFLTWVSGGFRSQSWSIFSAWVSGGLAMGLGALALCSGETALAYLLGFFFGSVALSLMLEPFGSGRKDGMRKIPVPGLLKAGMWSSAMVLGAPIGTLFAFSGASVMGRSATVEAAILGITLLAGLVLIWRLFWNQPRQIIEAQLSPRRIVAAFGILVLCLSWIWTGDILGLRMDQDHGPSESILAGAAHIAGVFTGGSAEAVGLENIKWLYPPITLLAFALGYLLRGTWARIFRSLPALTAFFTSGYWVTLGVERFLEFLRSLGEQGDIFLVQKPWMGPLSRRGMQFFRRIFIVLSDTDRRLSSSAAVGTSRAMYVIQWIPYKMQSGDLQWYLVFGLGTLFLLLAFLIRSI